MTSLLFKVGLGWLFVGILIEFGYFKTIMAGWMVCFIGILIMVTDKGWYKKTIRPRWSTRPHRKIRPTSSSPQLKAKIEAQSCSRCGAPASNTQKCVYCGARFMEASD